MQERFKLFGHVKIISLLNARGCSWNKRRSRKEGYSALTCDLSEAIPFPLPLLFLIASLDQDNYIAEKLCTPLLGTAFLATPISNTALFPWIDLEITDNEPSLPLAVIYCKKSRSLFSSKKILCDLHNKRIMSLVSHSMMLSGFA